MYKGFWSYLFPTLIILSGLNFIWAWILTAVKAPQSSEAAPIPGPVSPHWKYVETVGPEGVGNIMTPALKSKREAAVSSQR